MPEDQEENLTARGLKTELIAPIGSTVGTILAGVLQESLSKPSLAILLICSLVLMTVGFWTYTAKLHRLRAKIPKLEQEILSLQSRPSPALKDTTPRDQVLIAVFRAGDDDSGIAEATGLSQARVDACLHELVQERMIDLIMQPWETAYHVVIPKGRSYLLDNHLIE